MTLQKLLEEMRGIEHSFAPQEFTWNYSNCVSPTLRRWIHEIEKNLESLPRKDESNPT